MKIARLSCRLDPATKSLLEHTAKRECRSVADQIIWMTLENHEIRLEGFHRCTELLVSHGERSERLNCRIDQDTKILLEEAASAECRSVAEQVTWMIWKYHNLYKFRCKQVGEGNPFYEPSGYHETF